ncbi:hypothetical protein [uncultured Vagococcus sp.]|uniref:hypothetical protein n=1 Tax=uncultured Vagococcus sp. TaxID=189676 RepID=UPI0028D7975B|nr:hypothetical protein [uncultured Vagococcus sp.]
MNQYCDECGAMLIKKEHEEGIYLYCTSCQQYKSPHFSAAMRTMIHNPSKDRLLLIKQGGVGDILTAGYVSPGSLWQ